MRTKMLLFVCLILLVSNYCNAQTWQWTHPEPNGTIDQNANPYLGNEQDVAHSVKTDAAGNVYVLGDFSDSLYLNQIFRTSGSGSYLAKYDSTGKLLWYKTIVPADYTNNKKIMATAFTVNAQGVFITGKYYGSYYTSYDCTTGINMGIDFSYKIGSYLFTSARNDVGYFITKFNSSGNVVWNKTATQAPCVDGGQPGIASVVYNPLITSDKNNNVIASFVIISDRSSVNINSDVISLGGSKAINPYQLVVTKYNSGGILQWSNFAGGGFNNAGNCGGGYGYIQDCNSSVADNSGNIYFYGTAYDSTFFGSQLFRTKDNSTGGCGYGHATFIAKLSAAGSWQFVKELCNLSLNTIGVAIGGQTPGNPSLLAADNANNVYAIVNSATQNDSATVGGIKEPRGVGDPNNFIVKLDKNGKTLWVKSFGLGVKAQNYSNDKTYSICYAANNLYITGELTNTSVPYRFSNLYVPPIGNSYNYFVGKADTTGTFKWATLFYSNGNVTQGFGVAVSGDNVYTCGYYVNSINGLGNLNGGTVNISDENIFFGKLKDQYIKVGAIAPATTCAGSIITIPFTSTGLTLSASNTFTAELSDAAGSFTTPVAIGTVSSRGSGSITATLPGNLLSGSLYIVRIRSSDTLATGYHYYAYADTGYHITIACPTPINLSTTNIAATSATLNWAATSCGVNYSVQIRPKGTTAWKTVTLAGTATSYTSTGLTANKAYQWRIATVCQTNPQILSAYSAIQSFTTASSFIADKTGVPSLEAMTANTLSITVSPNPASANAFVSVSGSHGSLTLTLTSMSGKNIWQNHTSDNSRIVIPMQTFAPATYLLSVQDNKQIKTIRVVKAD